MSVKVRKLRRWKQADEGWVRDMDCVCFPTAQSFENNESYHWWVAYEGTVPVGYAAVFVERCPKHMPKVAHFTRCGVVPHARGRGYQTLLIKARVKWCRDNGIDIVKTYTRIDNEPSMNNLLDAGFTRRKGKQWLHYKLVV